MAPRWLRNPYLQSAGLGVLFTLAFAPVFAWPVIPISLAGFYLLLLKSESPRAAFKLGWVFAFAHHVTGLYWMANALLTDPEKFAWMVPFAVSLIPAALAVYVGLVAYIFRRWCYGQAQTIAGIIQFAALWVVFEGLRGFLFTGFPWNFASYTLAFSDAMIQPASLFGVYGLSFAVVLVGTSFALLFMKPRRVVPFALCGVVLPLALFGYGAWRLSGAESADTGIRLRLVQPNISQVEKWRPDQRYRHLLEQIALSGPPGERPDIVIWPETAVSYFLHDDVKLQQLLTQELGSRTRLVTGAMRYRSTGPGEEDFDLYNALEIFRGGVIEAHYEKSLLVPFGEYVPLRTFLPFVKKITYGMRDFARGPGAVALSVPGSGLPPFQPLICYEGIFPFYRADEAKWLLNITNDGWFGLSSGPHQHFHMVRMRAVERGVPLVRVANTGISAVVDGYGRVVAAIPLGEKGVLDAVLPENINGGTIYVNLLERFTFAMVVGIAAISRITGKNKQNA